MKLVWSPDMASKAYIDTVKSCELHHESGAAELISAMAAGWNARFIMETWSQGGAVATSIGLAVASRHTGGRHVCLVPDERSRSEYLQAMEVAGFSPQVIINGQPDDGFVDIDFLVVDSRRKDFVRVLRLAKLSNRGAVLVCKNAYKGNDSSFVWKSVVDGRSRLLVRSVYLPVGKGLDIAYVAIRSENSSSGKGNDESRWI